MAGQENSKLIAVNRKARHDYFVMEAMEAGVELVGTEVKSIRTGAVNLKDSWVEMTGIEPVSEKRSTLVSPGAVHLQDSPIGRPVNGPPLR